MIQSVDEALVRSLEALLGMAVAARVTFPPADRRVLELALLVLERRRYAAEDELVRRKLARLGHDLGPARRTGGAGERLPVVAAEPAS